MFGCLRALHFEATLFVRILAMQFAAFISSSNQSKHHETPNSKILQVGDQGEVKSCNSDCHYNPLVLSHSANTVSISIDEDDSQCNKV